MGGNQFVSPEGLDLDLGLSDPENVARNFSQSSRAPMSGQDFFEGVGVVTMWGFYWANSFSPMPGRRITKSKFCVVRDLGPDATEDRNAICSVHYFFRSFKFHFCKMGAVDPRDTKVLSHDAVHNQLLLIFFSSVS